MISMIHNPDDPDDFDNRRNHGPNDLDPDDSYDPNDSDESVVRYRSLPYLHNTLFWIRIIFVFSVF